MSKTKSVTKDTKSAKDTLSKVKSAGVTKPALPTKSKSKYDKNKKDKKKAKEPTPEPESDSEESDSSESEAEVETKKPVANGKAKPAAKDESDQSSEEEAESDESDSSEDEAPAKAAPKANGASKVVAKEEVDDDSDSDSEQSDSDEEAAPVNGTAAAEEDDDDSEEDSDDSDDSEDEETEKPAPKTAKRKADSEAEPAAKKTKTESAETGKGKNLFVGNLSWNVDEDWLRSTFEEHGELVNVRLMMDRATNRSKGFGYVEFSTDAEAAAAHDALKGTELDGRTMNVDYASVKPDNSAQQNDRRKSYGDQLSEPTDTLFVGNLAFDVGQESVSEAFAPFGTIISVRLPTDRETGAPKGFGYVTFDSVEAAKTALEGMQGGYISSRPVRLDYSQPRQNFEGGGGRGGRGGGRGGDRGGFGGRGGGRGGSFGGRGGGGRGGGGFGGRGGGGGFGGRGGRGGRGGSTNRGGFGDFKGQKQTLD